MPTLQLGNEAPRLEIGPPGIRRISLELPVEGYPASTPQTGDKPAQVQMRMTVDDSGEWFEVGFTALGLAEGNAAIGFSVGNVLMELQQSLDLGTWNMGMFEDCAVTGIDNGDGTFTYWSRSTQPRIWKYVTIDLTLTSNRAAKDITALKLFGSTISLPNYPYSMPSEAAQLQTDLIAAGYTGATVSSVAAPLSVEVKNFLSSDTQTFPVTLSGSDVTAVKNASGTTISLPGYPYAMPSQAATMRSALVAAGYPYAQVMAYDDEWTISIPDRSTTFANRTFTATITPADPWTYQVITGTGTDAGNGLSGTFSNVRATTGFYPLTEADEQFARLKITRRCLAQAIRRKVPSNR